MSEVRKRRPAPVTTRTRRRAGPAVGRQQQRFTQRYRGLLLLGVAAIVVTAAIVIFAIKYGPSTTNKEQAAGARPADPALVSALTTIPPTTFDAVGAGSAGNPPRTASSAPALQKDGKPELLYVGAEYCPYCAAQRWAMIIALSRFGTFSNLHTTRSAANDVYANTPTFTFYGSQYSSQYLSFVPVEQTTNQPSGNAGYTPLQSLSADQQMLLATYDRPPYTDSAGGIPFTDYGGTLVHAGAMFDPGLLANKDWSQIAALLTNPASDQSKAIIGSANLITASICRITGGQPGNVCQSAGVQQAAAKLGGS